MLLLRNVNPCLRFRTLEIPTYTTSVSYTHLTLPTKNEV